MGLIQVQHFLGSFFSVFFFLSFLLFYLDATTHLYKTPYPSVPHASSLLICYHGPQNKYYAVTVVGNERKQIETQWQLIVFSPIPKIRYGQFRWMENPLYSRPAHPS